MRRYVIFGAGAVGGLIGAHLHRSGQQVTLVARGAHLEAMHTKGLTIRTAGGAETVRVPVTADPAELTIAAEDVVILGMKTQDAALVLPDLAAMAHPGAAIVCAQNGIESERLAQRFFNHVYGCYVYVNAVQVEPGVVRLYNEGRLGILDIGRYPDGSDARAADIAADLEGSGFSSRATADVMYWKRAKLILNTLNASQAACSDRTAAKEFIAATIAEARLCMDAAGLAYASDAEVAERASVLHNTLIDGEGSPGGSTYQSLARGNATTEADYLNGEIAMMGRRLGIPTPANSALQALVRRMARDGRAPCSVPPDEIRALIAAAARG